MVLRTSLIFPSWFWVVFLFFALKSSMHWWWWSHEFVHLWQLASNTTCLSSSNSSSSFFFFFFLPWFLHADLDVGICLALQLHRDEHVSALCCELTLELLQLSVREHCLALELLRLELKLGGGRGGGVLKEHWLVSNNLEERVESFGVEEEKGTTLAPGGGGGVGGGGGGEGCRGGSGHMSGTTKAAAWAVFQHHGGSSGNYNRIYGLAVRRPTRFKVWTLDSIVVASSSSSSSSAPHSLSLFLSEVLQTHLSWIENS